MRNQLRDLGAQYGIPTVMVEVSHSEVPFDSFDNVRGRAIHIHDELTYADAVAFFGMNAMWDTTTHAQHYEGRADPGFYSETDTIVLIDIVQNKVVISPMGRAIGHYARWISRGAVRIDATSDDPLVQVTAFRDDGQGRIVLVAINNAAVARALQVSLQGLPALPGTFTGEQSTASAAWSPLGGTTTATGWSIDLPALSVTSIAAGAPTGAGADAGGDAGPGSGGQMGGCCGAGGADPRGILALAALVLRATGRPRRAENRRQAEQ